jgi:hypothetical protein
MKNPLSRLAGVLAQKGRILRASMSDRVVRKRIFEKGRFSFSSDCFALLFLAGAVMLFFWPVWLADYRFPWGGGDLWGQLHPVWNYVAAWVRRGVFPLWSTRMMAGDPIIAEQQYGLLNPVNWPMFLFSPIPPWLISLRGAFSLWLAGAGMVLYLRHSPVWHMGKTAAMVGAVAYMFSDPFVMHLGHPQFNDTMAWLPWVLWGLDGVMRGARAIPWAGLALGLLLLAGHGQAALYAALLISAYAAAGAFNFWHIPRWVAPSLRCDPFGALTRGNYGWRIDHSQPERRFALTALLLRVGRLVLVAVVGACLAAPAILPGLARFPYTERALILEGSQRGYEFMPDMWIDFITPHFHGRGVKGFWPVRERVESGYVGVVALALAGLGLLTEVCRWGHHVIQSSVTGSHNPNSSERAVNPRIAENSKRSGVILSLVEGSPRRALFLLLIGVLAYLFALGYQGPLYPLVDRLPFFSASWKTSRAIYLVSFVLAVGAGLGVERLIPRARRQASNIKRHRWGVIVWIVTVGLGAVWVGMRASRWVADIPVTMFQERALAYLRFAAMLLGLTALLGLWIRLRWQAKATSALAGGSAGATAFLLLLLAELVATGAMADVEKRPRAEEDPHAAAIAYLREDPGWFRVDVDARARGLWSPAAVMAAGFDVAQGTGNPMEIAAYNQFYWAIPTKGSPAYSLLGAKYIVVPKDAQPGGEGIWPVFKDDALIDLHLNTNSLPRAWLVYRTQRVATIEEAYAVVFDPDFQPVLMATVKDGPQLMQSSVEAEGRIEVLAYGPNSAAFKVDTTKPALLVLSDLLYPGWRARLDKQRVPLYKTNGIFRGVLVPAGVHIVTMQFFPRELGVGLGLVGMLVWALGILRIKQFAGWAKLKS